MLYTFISDIPPGDAAVAGAKHPRTSTITRVSTKPNILQMKCETRLSTTSRTHPAVVYTSKRDLPGLSYAEIFPENYRTCF